MSSGAKAKTFRRARMWPASLIALSLGALAATFIAATKVGQSLELAVSDILRAARPLPDESVTARVTTIEINDLTLEKGGRWPWPRSFQAEVLDALASLGPRLILLDIEYSEPEQPRVESRIRADGASDHVIVEHPDEQLRESIRRAGNVLLGFSLYLADRPEASGRGVAAEAGRTALPPVLVRHAADLAPSAAARVMEAEGFNPMIPPLGEACAGAGYTSVIRDVDHTLRWIPVLARAGGRAFPHLALELAGHWEFGPDYRLALEPRWLTLSSGDRTRSVSVPVDARGRLALRWPRRLDALTRIGAQRLVNLALARRDLRQHQRRLELIQEDLKALFPQERDPMMALLDYQDRPDGGGQGLEDRRARAARTFLPFLRDYDAARKALQDHVAVLDRGDEKTPGIRPYVEGRICALGLTATGMTMVTDQHKTPISGSQPGVTVYGIAARTILSGVAFRRLPSWGAWSVAFLAAWLVGLVTVHLATVRGVAATVALSAAIFGAGWAASRGAAVLLPTAGPILAVVVAFGGVSAYRQLTEEAGRRWATSLAKQFVPPDHVEQIARHPELLRLGGERRDITVIFSDVAGFTPLSEKLGPEQLNQLLYHYLGAMTAIIYQEHGTLDKYEGDGMMAFFGAPIPLADHALLAVRAALGMHAALPRLNEDLRRMGLLPPDRQIRIRVGCSTGPAMVGNFGAEQRFNYTAMGDTVNLGGRLEEANRWLGSRILVPGPTREACGQAILFRPFGQALIRGKAERVFLYEPLALEPAPEELRAIAETFVRGIEALSGGDLAASEAAAREILARRPDDGPARTLLARLQAIRAGQAPADETYWNLAGREK
jgi:class 3 adenylate cyclase/CHASE2 domain-containing sensor protein